MIDLYYYDREGNPIPGKVPTQLRVIGGDLSGTAAAAIQRAFNQFTTAYRLGLYESLSKRLVIDRFTTLLLQVNHGVFTAQATVTPQIDEDLFFGGIVVQLERITDINYFTDVQGVLGDSLRGPDAYPPEGLRTLLPEHSRNGGDPKYTVFGPLGDRDVGAAPTNTLIFQIQPRGDLASNPVTKGLVKIYRVRSPLVGNLCSHDLDGNEAGGNVASANLTALTPDDQFIDSFAFCGQPVPMPTLTLPDNTVEANALPKALRFVRLYAMPISTPAFAQGNEAKFIWIVATMAALYVCDMTAPAPAWVAIAFGSGSGRPFGVRFTTETGENRRIVCYGEDHGGALSGFKVTVSESNGSYTFQGLLDLAPLQGTPATPPPGFNQSSSWTNVRHIFNHPPIPKVSISTDIDYPNAPANFDDGTLTLTAGPDSTGEVRSITMAWESSWTTTIAYNTRYFVEYVDPFTGRLTALNESYDFSSSMNMTTGVPVPSDPIDYLTTLPGVSGADIQVKLNGTPSIISAVGGDGIVFLNQASPALETYVGYTVRGWLVAPRISVEFPNQAANGSVSLAIAHPMMPDGFNMTLTMDSTATALNTGGSATLTEVGLDGFDYDVVYGGAWLSNLSTVVTGQTSGALQVPVNVRQSYPGGPSQLEGYVGFDHHARELALRPDFRRDGSTWVRPAGPAPTTHTAQWSACSMRAMLINRSELPATDLRTDTAYVFDASARFPGMWQNGAVDLEFTLPNASSFVGTSEPTASIPSLEFQDYGPKGSMVGSPEADRDFYGFFPFIDNMLPPMDGYFEQVSPSGNYFFDSGNPTTGYLGPGTSAFIWADGFDPVPEGDEHVGTFTASINTNEATPTYTKAQYEALGSADAFAIPAAELPGTHGVNAYHVAANTAYGPVGLVVPVPDTQIIDSRLYRDPRTGGYIFQVFADAALGPPESFPTPAPTIAAQLDLMLGNEDGCVPLVDVLNEWLRLQDPDSTVYVDGEIIIRRESAKEVSLI